ncbi:MAG: hypothetical protein IJC04_03860 [Oscillospiraceae bacterium]|nr:hypothetical protein [Oscillospiraceae bacterium]
MKQFNKSKLCALVTTAAVFMSNVAVFPAVNVFAEDNEPKTATITLTDNYSKTLSFSDIPQAEEKQTTVTLAQDWSKSIDFTGVDTENGESRNISEAYEFQSWDDTSTPTAEIIAAIEDAADVDLPEYPTIYINDIAVSYSWKFTPADGETVTNGEITVIPSGDNASGEYIGGKNNTYTFDSNVGNGTIAFSELADKGDIVNPRHMWINAGAFSKNATDTFEFNVTSVELNVTYLDGESGGYKGFYDDDTQSGQWHFAAHSPNEDDGDRSADIVAAIKALNGDETQQWAVKVTDMTVNYSWELTTDKENFEFNLNPVVMGNTPAGTETWVEADYWAVNEQNYKTITTKTGSDSFKASTLFTDTGITVEDIHCMDINGGMWTDNPNDELTVSVTEITLNVEYTIEEPPVEAFVSYEEVQDMKYIRITGDVISIEECNHDSHIGDDGIDHGTGLTYCPWPYIGVYKVDAEDNWSEACYDCYSANAVSSGGHGSEYVECMFSMNDIINTVGELSEGEKYAISTDSLTTVEYEMLASKPDMILDTGSYESGTIEEAMDWDPETNSSTIPTGIPNITPTFAIYENNNAVPFEGYEAIKIDYTAESPEACYGVLVVLHGWEDNSTGWMEKFYAMEESGSIVIDLSELQDKVFHNIYVGPVAPGSAIIGDEFAPGFAVTEAVILTSYDGDFTEEIEKVVPDAPVFVTTADGKTGFKTLEEAMAELKTATGDIEVIVNHDLEVAALAIPKNVDSITFTGEGSITFTGTKLAVPVDTMFDVKLAAKNKTNLIDITVAKDVELFITENAYILDEETDEPVQFINKLTGTKTSKFSGFAIVNNIATFGEVNVEEGYLKVNGGKATGIVKLGGIFVIIGDKATAAITEVADDAEIILVINGTVIPKVTIDKFGKAVWVGVYDEDEHRIALPSGTTILYTKNPIPTGEDAIVVKNKTALEDGEELTAYYYAKTKSIKAEVGTALDLYKGEEISEETKVGNYPNFELLFADITDPEADYIIEVNTDLTLDAKFALPKNAKSITFTGNATLTFTGTKLTIPYDVTFDRFITIDVSNKKGTIDIAVGKDATLTAKGDIECIGKLSGTKTSNIDGDFIVQNLATFDKVSGAVWVKGGKATGVNVLDGYLELSGAKASAAIKTATVNSTIELNKENGVLPKVTLEGIGEAIGNDTTINVLIMDNGVYSNLESGTAILYTKKENFADKISITNNDGEMKAYCYGKTIKAEYPGAVIVSTDPDSEEDDKDYSNYELAVAEIDAAKDNNAEYVITIKKDIAPAKFTLPKYAKSVKLTVDGAPRTIDIGKATAITANTDLSIQNIAFVTTGKSLTITAKKNLTVDDLYGNVTAIKGGAKSVLNWRGESADTAKADITGFGEVKVDNNLTTGKVFNVTKLVLGKAESAPGTLLISAATTKSSIKALEALSSNSAIRYEEGAKALTFTGKDTDFTGTLKITGEVANGQAVLTTKTVSVDKLTNDIAPANEDVEYGFTQMGKDICYMGKVLYVEIAIGEEEPTELDAYATWGEVVEVIEAENNSEAIYKITLRDDYNANAAIKFPKAGTCRTIIITCADEVNFNFTGNLTLTVETVFRMVNMGAVKNGAPAKYTINAGKNYVFIENCNTGLLTSIAGKDIDLRGNENAITADKIKATGTLFLEGDVKASGGITAKNVAIYADTNLVMNQGSKITATGYISRILGDNSKITVTILDKNGNVAALKKGYVVATVKGTYHAGSIVLDEKHEGFALKLVKGKLVVVEDTGEEEVSFWTVNGNTCTYKSVYGSKTGENDTEYDFANDMFEQCSIDISALLEEGKTINDIRSITLNYSVNNTANPDAWVSGYAGLCINPDFTWITTSTYEPNTETDTYAGSFVLETPEGVSPGNLLIYVEQANPDSECTFTIELTYAS